MHVVHGRRKPEILAIIAPHLDPLPEIERLTQLETERVGAVRPIPGAVELVAKLPAGRWAIATSGERPGALLRLKQVGITPPAVVITAEDVEQGKPHPDVYLKAAAGLGVRPARCLVFEDAPAGIDAANAAGMTAIAVLTTYPAEEFPHAFARIPNLEPVAVSVKNREMRINLI
jgi:sugar-phosphatase